MSELHKIVSYWDGKKPLHYIHHICLASFVDKGHEVTLYTLPDQLGNLDVPKGVFIRSVDDFREGISTKITELFPATAADFLRILLVQELGAIWADTDVYCLQPFEKKRRYIFAHEGAAPLKEKTRGSINNAVLAFPEDSESLALLKEYVEAELGYLQAPTPAVRAYIEGGIGHAVLKHGPRALTYFLILTGEIREQMHPKELYPIHFNLSDCYWDPEIDVTTRFRESTIATHIWDSQVRAGWYRRSALKGSFMWKAAHKHGIDMERLKRRK